jgi:hypothetical protein
MLGLRESEFPFGDIASPQQIHIVGFNQALTLIADRSDLQEKLINKNARQFLPGKCQSIRWQDAGRGRLDETGFAQVNRL